MLSEEKKSETQMFEPSGAIGDFGVFQLGDWYKRVDSSFIGKVADQLAWAQPWHNILIAFLSTNCLPIGIIYLAMPAYDMSSWLKKKRFF